MSRDDTPTDKDACDATSLLAGFQQQLRGHRGLIPDDRLFLRQMFSSRAVEEARLRMLIARAIVRCAVTDALATHNSHGAYVLSVWDGRAYHVPRFQSVQGVMATMLQETQSAVSVRQPTARGWQYLGATLVTLGNRAAHVITGYSSPLFPVMRRASALAQDFAFLLP